MLVLGREVGESIMLGDDIRITVSEIRSNGQVRIGIEAPAGVEVHRLEVWKRIQKEKQANVAQKAEQAGRT